MDFRERMKQVYICHPHITGLLVAYTIEHCTQETTQLLTTELERIEHICGHAACQFFFLDTLQKLIG